MEELGSTLKTKYSVRLKLLGVFLVFLAGLLAILNIYPAVISRDLVFTSTQTSLQGQAAVISSSLSALETLSEDGVSQVMALLDLMPVDRVLVTDETGKIVYDTLETGSQRGSYALFSEISQALQGKAVFYSRFADRAFISRAAAPVTNRGAILGAVYLSEHDADQAALISDIRARMSNISIGAGGLALIAVLIFASALTRRITELVRALRVVREGSYDHRLKVRGNDELSELGHEFNNMTRRIEQTEEMRRRFVSDASHELKTPLASIRLLSDSIVQNSGMDVDTMREFVLDIGAEAERLQRTTDKLLQLTRMDRSARDERVPVDMRRAAENTLRLLEPLARERGIRLSWNLQEDCVIEASDDDIYRVIFNLVENAVKYNVDGGQVFLNLEKEPGFARLTVEDTGIGIPPDDLPNVFTRFYRVDKARSRDAGGSGLGLSIVHDAVVAHGGTVEAFSTLGSGSRFTVRFPLFEGREGTHE